MKYRVMFFKKRRISDKGYAVDMTLFGDRKFSLSPKEKVVPVRAGDILDLSSTNVVRNFGKKDVDNFLRHARMRYHGTTIEVKRTPTKIVFYVFISIVLIGFIIWLGGFFNG